MFLLLVLIAGLSLMLTNRGWAQTYTNLHVFAGSDGANPESVVVLSGKTLYGTTSAGGSSSNGTIFAVNTDGSHFTNLYNFTAVVKVYEGTFTAPGSSLPAPFYASTNGDGASPLAGLVLSGNTLYGTAAAGGGSNAGTIFAIHTDGTGFTNLHSFTGGSDGGDPVASLVLSGNILYGTTYTGGKSGCGTIFAINCNGMGFTNLYSFTFYPRIGIGTTNSDGAFPAGSLLVSGNTLYGTASSGGNPGSGTVFAINTDGSGFKNLHNFTGINDGADPRAGLILSGNTLDGTTREGGSGDEGTVFAVNTDGTGFTNLYSFSGYYSMYTGPNADGGQPLDSLIVLGNALYGTTPWDGTLGTGTLFTMNTNGTKFTCIYHYNDTNGGAYSVAGLTFSGNTLYGTTDYGGSGNGTVYALSLPPPQLTMRSVGTNIVITWPTNMTGFDPASFTLQSSPQAGRFASWSSVASLPDVVNGLETVTNAVTGTQKFFRLSQ